MTKDDAYDNLMSLMGKIEYELYDSAMALEEYGSSFNSVAAMRPPPGLTKEENTDDPENVAETINIDDMDGQSA